MSNVQEQLLYAADRHDQFAYLNGNDIPYLHDNFGHHLAAGSVRNIGNLHELKAALNEGKQLFGHFNYETGRNTLPPYLAFPELRFFEPEHYFNLREEQDAALRWAEPSTNKPKIPQGEIHLSCNFTENHYLATVERIRQHIEEGDCYELNLCMQFTAENVSIDPVDTYLKLNSASSMPFSALYKTGDHYLICASPERFLKKEGPQLISQPIKGTIRKGSTAEENEVLKQQLLASEKERAENLMIVDLVRNDLARSARPGSVKVEELFGIYDFSRVNQMISTVVATQREEVSSLQTIENAFPMGSMTGAPKVKVMELIEAYERTGRGIYSGTVGHFDENGNFDFNVVIRSIVYDRASKKLSFHVGSAITYDSVAQEEYHECLLKANAIMEVLGVSTAQKAGAN